MTKVYMPRLGQPGPIFRHDPQHCMNEVM